jgi:hypothetical protein
MTERAAPDTPETRVSVLMSARNGERYLPQSVASILRQSLDDLELLVLDDASTDGTAELLRGLARQDRRMRLFRNEIRGGVAAGLNRLAGLAGSPVCARMDADDIAYPERLRRQWEALRANPEIVLVGTLWEGIDATGRLVRPRDRWPLWRGAPTPPFPAGSVMFRRAAFQDVAGYRDLPWEDVDLAVRMARRGRVVVLPEVLYRYRFHVNSASQSHEREAMLASLAGMYGSIPRSAQHGAGRAGRHRSAGLPSPSDQDAWQRAAYCLDASRVWAGGTPYLLTPGVRERGNRGISALKVAMLRTLGPRFPGALRRMLRAAVWARDHVAAVFVRGSRPIEWEPP